MSGSQETFCSAACRLRSALNSKSPRARLTAKRPSIRGRRPPRTTPPAAMTRAFSWGLSGLWSTVSKTKSESSSSSCFGSLMMMPRESPQLMSFAWYDPFPSCAMSAPTTVLPELLSSFGRCLRCFRRRLSTVRKPCWMRPSEGSLPPLMVCPISFGSASAPKCAASAPRWPSRSQNSPRLSEQATECASSWLSRWPCVSTTAQLNKALEEVATRNSSNERGRLRTIVHDHASTGDHHAAAKEAGAYKREAVSA
mmetsp:Transcript_148134/g.369306  ORF Transcript_148134/g.369306 Transcript_148134/m.369306 type:complete len:254 (+) Transcript_148134:326-1087(+)